jgi:hypothetical protein
LTALPGSLPEFEHGGTQQARWHCIKELDLTTWSLSHFIHTFLETDALLSERKIPEALNEMAPSRPNCAKTNSDDILELQLFQRAKNILSQRRGNECHYNVVCRTVCRFHTLTETFLRQPQHYAVYDQATGVHHLHEPRSTEGKSCSVVLDKLMYRRRSHSSSRGGIYSKRGKSGSGDKPKPKPQPIDPSKKVSRWYMDLSITHCSSGPLGVCVDMRKIRRDEVGYREVLPYLSSFRIVLQIDSILGVMA